MLIKDMRNKSNVRQVWAGYTRFNETHFRDGNDSTINEATWTSGLNRSGIHTSFQTFVISSSNSTYTTAGKSDPSHCICRYFATGYLLLFIFMSLANRSAQYVSCLLPIPMGIGYGS